MAMGNSKEWTDIIIARLFEHDDNQVKDKFEKLILANNEWVNQNAYGFIHQGKRYARLGFERQVANIKTPLPNIHFKVNEQCNDWMGHHRRIELDKTIIRQTLFKLLYQCNNKQELRDALPDCVVTLLPELHELKRVMQPETLIRNDPAALRLYQDVLPKLQFYSMTKFLF